MVSLRIKYLSDKIEKLRYIDGKSDWIDLRAAERVELKAGEFRLIPLGIAMELPKGYEAHIVPRSSTFKNFGEIQTNHCVNKQNNKNQKIEHQPAISFDEAETLGNDDRGGIGSTGKN